MSVQINVKSERLGTELEKLATFSDVPSPAVTRVLYSKTDMAARAWLRGLLRDAGLTLHEDAIGNLFARWAGSEPELPAVATGSHIDAIPYSGMYDGTVGVLGGLEAIRALKEAGFEPKRSIELILFTAEEPTRFGIGCLGSRAMAGMLDQDRLLGLTDNQGQTLNELRREAGYSGELDTIQLNRGHYHSFIELHIEQGARLEAARQHIGVVVSIAAPATLRVTLFGDGGHAGAVLMPNRRDALVAASEIVLEVDKTARGTGREDSVATVGLQEIYPGAVNSIPSRVLMEIDIRDTDLETRDKMVAQIKDMVEKSCVLRDIRVEMELLNADPPSQSDNTVITAIVRACEASGISYQKLVSRAYHDTLFMAQICPTAMIFIPSKHGYSHRPEEYSSPGEITKGVDILAQTLADLSLE